jgi:hypothetical protein
VDDLTKILVAAVASIVGGLTVLVVGQALMRFIFDPIQDLNKLRGEIAHTLIYHANVPRGQTEKERARQREAADELRRLAAKLRAQSYVIPKHAWWAQLGWIPPRRTLNGAAGELIGLSNSFVRPEDVLLTEGFRHRAASQLNINDSVKALLPPE